MNTYLTLIYVLLSLALSSGAPQSPGSFQFIKKDGKVINAFGNVPSTVESAKTSGTSKAIADSTCKFNSL